MCHEETDWFRQKPEFSVNPCIFISFGCFCVTIHKHACAIAWDKCSVSEIIHYKSFLHPCLFHMKIIVVENCCQDFEKLWKAFP